MQVQEAKDKEKEETKKGISKEHETSKT